MTVHRIFNIFIDIIDQLSSSGAFQDPLEHEIRNVFLPKNMESVKENFNRYLIAARMANELLEAAREKSVVFEETAVSLREKKRLVGCIYYNI